MRTIFKIFTEFVPILLLFYVLVLEPQVLWDPQPWIGPAPPALEGGVLATGLPGKISPLRF